MSRPELSIYGGMQPIQLPDPLAQATKVANLQDIIQQGRLRNEQLLDAQKKRQHDQRVASIIANSDVNEPDWNSSKHPIGALRSAGLFDDAKKIEDQLREAKTMDWTQRQKELDQVKEAAGLQAQYGQAILGVPQGGRVAAYQNFYSTLGQHAKTLGLEDPSTLTTEDAVTNWAQSHRDAGTAADKLATLLDNEAKNTESARHNKAEESDKLAGRREKVIQKPVDGELHDFGYDSAANDWTKDLGRSVPKDEEGLPAYIDGWFAIKGVPRSPATEFTAKQAFYQRKENLSDKDKDVASFLESPALTKKYGATRTGFEQWRDDVDLRKAATGRQPQQWEQSFDSFRKHPELTAVYGSDLTGFQAYQDAMRDQKDPTAQALTEERSIRAAIVKDGLQGTEAEEYYNNRRSAIREQMGIELPPYNSQSSRKPSVGPPQAGQNFPMAPAPVPTPGRPGAPPTLTPRNSAVAQAKTTTRANVQALATKRGWTYAQAEAAVKAQGVTIQ